MPDRDLPELKAVCFDFDGTLTDFVAADLAALEQVRRLAGVPHSRETFVDMAVEAILAFHGRVERGEADPLRMHEVRLREVLDTCGVAWHAGYLEAYRTHLLRACAPLPGAQALLTALRPRFKLALLTNAYDGAEQRARLRHSGLEGYFDVVVVSGEVGVFKPDPRIFQHTLELLGVTPKQALYVGDSPTHDVRGAALAGLRAVLVGRRTPHPGAWRTVPSLLALAEGWTR
ncbi:HAD family hydrolase [Deinococcus sp. SDU3-2]|uniref:HAD family hydrolase n=1 Tax=Deinococcus terrestris TaxID=2651870 RepID=A0A7X1NYE8_9DEIO|nr:HAD family hydrolase [Deinococcus terrestris]MPY68100.1 HAD family hydrolase [Deinococcus terrestris]